MSTNDQCKALLFDIGDVLIGLDFKGVFKRLSSYSDLSNSDVEARFSMDAEYRSHECGMVSEQVYFDHLRKRLQLDITDLQLRTIWNSLFTGEISSAVDAIKSIRHQIPCYAFSNTNKTHKQYLLDSYPTLSELFTHVYTSPDIHRRKPDPSAFQYVCDHIGVEPCAIHFFDDTQENIIGAQAIGIACTHVVNELDVTKTIATFRDSQD